MRILGVVDVLGGRAVHARAGLRDRYEPVQTVAGENIGDGDPAAVVRAYLRMGITELYAADLDAILGRARQDAAIASIAAAGAPLWVDAAIASPDAARRALELSAAVVVVGLETLPSYAALSDICASAGSDRVAFSLDLRNGDPIVGPGVASEPAHVIAARAADAGAAAIIVIDLAQVGVSRGVDVDLIGRVRDAAPDATLLAGGGVRGFDDLARLSDAGCDGALVATALHEGRLGAADLTAVRRLQRSARR
jgi:phosphoribosylformimino-5-aminoimidazole carboxamide ribotide isomerase